MKLRATVVLISFCTLVVIASAQSSMQDQGQGQASHARGFWTDQSTRLMWTGKDNGKDVSWKKAMKYCRDLRLAGYSDWRLATLGELEGIYDKDANAVGGDGSTWHVKGNLFLTGNQWSSSRLVDDRGHPSGYASRFDFNEGRVFNGDELSFHTNKRALCVRGSGE
jgi:hypothetical protein